MGAGLEDGIEGDTHTVGQRRKESTKRGRKEESVDEVEGGEGIIKEG